jgi:hypothetical protein
MPPAWLRAGFFCALSSLIDKSDMFAAQPRRLRFNGGTQNHSMKTKSALLLIGGIIQVLVFALHVAMVFGNAQRAAPAGMDATAWAKLQSSLHIFNASVATAVLCFAYVSLFKRAELLTTGLGRTICAFIAAFYLQRMLVPVIVRGVGSFLDPVFTPLLLGTVALYAFAAVPSRARSVNSSQSSDSRGSQPASADPSSL